MAAHHMTVELVQLRLPPMTSQNNIRFGNTTIDYQVRRSKRRKKTVQIVLSGGGVRVLAPMATPDSELQAIVRKRVPWILKHASQSTLDAEPKRFVSGETLPYLGRNVPLHVETAGVLIPTVRLYHWRFRIAVPDSLSGEDRRNRYVVPPSSGIGNAPPNG